MSAKAKPNHARWRPRNVNPKKPGIYECAVRFTSAIRGLLARVERLELTVQELGLRNADLEAHIKSLEAINENNLAEAAARIVDLEAVLSETVALYGKPGGPWNIPSDPGGWLERARAVIDAARGAK